MGKNKEDYNESKNRSINDLSESMLVTNPDDSTGIYWYGNGANIELRSTDSTVPNTNRETVIRVSNPYRSPSTNTSSSEQLQNSSPRVPVSETERVFNPYRSPSTNTSSSEQLQNSSPRIPVSETERDSNPYRSPSPNTSSREQL